MYWETIRTFMDGSMFWSVVGALLFVFVGIPLALCAVGVVLAVLGEGIERFDDWLGERGWRQY